MGAVGGTPGQDLGVNTAGTALTAISYEFQSTLLFIAESISTN